MTKKDDNIEHEPLTEEQRITALEDKVGTNKIVLISMALFLIVAVSVSATFLVVSLLGKGDTSVESKTVIALQDRVTELEKTIVQSTKANKASLIEMQALKKQLASSSNLTLQQIILDQERGHQTFLETLRSGMYDLAHMLPGSRTWLEVYGEKVDSAEKDSKNREKALLKLKSGAASAQESTEDPFSEGF